MGKQLGLSFGANLSDWANIFSMPKPWLGCYALHCFADYMTAWDIQMHFIPRVFLSCPDSPCLMGPQVTLKKPESWKQHNNEFTFSFWSYSWRFLVVWERNALVSPFLKTAENSFLKCLKEKTSSLNFPQIGGSIQINPKMLGSRLPPTFPPVELTPQCSCPILDLSLHWFSWVYLILAGLVCL